MLVLLFQVIPAYAVDPDCWVKLYVRENLDALDANDTIAGPGLVAHHTEPAGRYTC